MLKHKVVYNDTLTKIANKYNTTINAIMKANSCIKNPNIINVGWVLNIPTNDDVIDNDDVKNNLDIKSVLNECLTDIENLPSFKKLMSML